MKVKDVMRTRKLVSARLDDELAVAAQLMRWAGVRHLPIVDDHDVVVGVLAERDLLRHRADGIAESGTVRQHMSGPAEVITPDEEVAAACALLVARHIGCLPVVDEGGRLVGIVTTSDLLGTQMSLELGSASAGSTRVELAMRRHPASVPPYAPLLEAVAIMVERGVRHVPVTNDAGRVVGILSDRDVRTAIGDPLEALRQELEELEEMKVSGVMTTDVITVPETARVDEAARLFLEEPVGALPVVDGDGRLVGILSYVDVIRALLPPSAAARPAADAAARPAGEELAAPHPGL